MDRTNILVVYFSRTGTTEHLAEYAAEYLNADLFQIEAAVSYTDAVLATLNHNMDPAKRANLIPAPIII